MDEQTKLLKSILEAIEINNSKIEALEQNGKKLEQTIKEGFQGVNERLDELEAGQTVLAQRLFQNEKEVERIKRVK